MKQCSICNEIKPLENFAWKQKSKGRKAANCKDCQKVLRKLHYINNKQVSLDRTKANKAKVREWYIDYKNGLTCERCGFNHPAALQFHHREPDTKDIEVSVAVGIGWSVDSVLREIAKCEVLCANCHCIEHFHSPFV